MRQGLCVGSAFAKLLLRITLHCLPLRPKRLKNTSGAREKRAATGKNEKWFQLKQKFSIEKGAWDFFPVDSGTFISTLLWSPHKFVLLLSIAFIRFPRARFAFWRERQVHFEFWAMFSRIHNFIFILPLLPQLRLAMFRLRILCMYICLITILFSIRKLFVFSASFQLVLI